MPEPTADTPAVSEQPTTDAAMMPGADVTATEIIRRVNPTSLTRATHAAILSDDEIRRVWRTAAALAQSGMWLAESESKITPEVAFAKILIGRDLGLSPTRALMTIDLVRGAIMMRGVLLAAWIRESPDYHYVTRDHSHTSCTVVLLGFPQDEPEEGFVRSAGRWWEVLGEETFTLDDAKRQGLVKSGSAWEKTPRNMLLWRAISNAVKFYAPDLLGGVPVYVEGELPPAEPSLTAGVGDGEAQGIDLGPKVEAVLARAAEARHTGLADRATAEMALMGQPPAVFERWVAEASAELDRFGEGDGEVTDAEVVEDHKLVEVRGTGKSRIGVCSCGWESPTLDTKGKAEQAVQVHVERSAERPTGPDPVEEANRAEALRSEAQATREQAEEASDEQEADALRTMADEMDNEANAISSGEQGSLDVGA